MALVTSQPQTYAVDARAALRRSTREIHERLHHHQFFHKLLSGTVDLIEYRQALARLFGFHDPLEETLLAAVATAGVAIDLKRGRRAHRLAEDLHFLGMDRSEIECLPRIWLAPPSSAGQFLGCLYVREGSMKGGRWIAQKISALLGSVGGRSFFLGGPVDDELWNECCAAISLAGENDVAEMTSAAHATFAAFEAWISKP